MGATADNRVHGGKIMSKSYAPYGISGEISV